MREEGRDVERCIGGREREKKTRIAPRPRGLKKGRVSARFFLVRSTRAGSEMAPPTVESHYAPASKPRHQRESANRRMKQPRERGRSALPLLATQEKGGPATNIGVDIGVPLHRKKNRNSSVDQTLDRVLANHSTLGAPDSKNAVLASQAAEVTVAF